MSDDDFEYDVAFSFAAVDEAIATQLNDLLSPRLRTFLYSERQREIAGTDGQESFSKVYGKTARIVVVLFRSEWGETPWTRVERDAIKNRSLEEGWDFTTFVAMVERPQLPPWFPKTRLYVGLERWGIGAAAAVIEARVGERGGSPRLETVTERADRFARKAALKQQQEQFQRSDTGVKAALQAYEDFSVALEQRAKLVSSAGVPVEVTRSQDLRVLTGLLSCNSVCHFRPHFLNSLDDAYLQVTCYKGFPPLPGWYGSDRKAQRLKSLRFSYELVRSDYHCWVDVNAQEREFTSSQLADHVLQTYMDVAEQTRPD